MTLNAKLINSSKSKHANDNRDSSSSPGVSQNSTAPSEKSPTEDVLRDIAIEKVRKKMTALREDIIEQMDHQLDSLTSEVLQEVKMMGLAQNHLHKLFEENSNHVNRKKSDKDGVLPAKQFLARNSLLTDLFEIKHIRTLYHMFVVILIILFLNTMVYDFVADGKINFGLTLIIVGFGKFQYVIMIWLLMQMSSFGIYVAYSYWANKRTEFKPKSTLLWFWDRLWLILFVSYQFAFLIVPVLGVLHYDLPPASSAVVLSEQVRFIMKNHAFVRTNAGRALAFKSHSDEKNPCPGFSKFLYFLFSPTLVYRDSYPRTKQIRWKAVAWNYLEVLTVIFYISFILERFLLPFFNKFGEKPTEPGVLVLSIFGSMMPSTLMFLCSFYCILHAWLNASSEMLRFADRMFYKDWWNSSSYGTYYKTWNVVVHDWLYTYIYKDMYEIIYPKSKIFATLLVFIVSAIVHEFIICFMFRFFYPVMLVLFGGFGVLFMFITKREHSSIGNIFMWLSLCLGNGIMMSLYTMEFYARVNCPLKGDSWLDYFVPVSWTCTGFMPNPDWQFKHPFQ